MDDLIIVRGGGDLATAVIHRLWSAGFRVMALEIYRPCVLIFRKLQKQRK